MKVLFLDLDGVINQHQRWPGSIYNRTDHDCVVRLNHVIAETGCKIVLSTAWRYQILNAVTSVRGLEYTLFTHGLVAPVGTVIGLTPADEIIPRRGQQILAALFALRPQPVEAWAVIDDNPKDMGLEKDLGEHAWRFVQTDGERGMSWQDAHRLVEILGRIGRPAESTPVESQEHG